MNIDHEKVKQELENNSNTEANNPSSAKGGKSNSRKIFKGILLSLISVILSIVFLLVSPWGIQLTLNLADSAIDELDVEYASGGLFNELHLTSVQWQQPDTQARVNELKLDVSLSCLLVGEVCIESFSAGSIEANIALGEETAESESAPASLLTMPVPVSIKRIELGELSVSLQDQLDLTWQSLSAEISFYQILVIETFSIKSLDVTTYTQEAQTLSSSATTASNTQPLDFSQIKYEPIKSMPVVLPLHVQIKQFALPDLTLNIAQQAPIEFKTIQLQMAAGAKKIQIHQLAIEHQQGKLNLKGTLGLEGNLEHQLTLNAQGELVPAQAVNVTLNSKGNIQKLSTEVKVSGPFEFGSTIKAQLSDPKLPLSIKANWQDVNWPLNAENSQPDIQSVEGNVSLSGDLSKLNLDVHSQVAGKSIPKTNIQLAGWADLFNSKKQVNIQQLVLQTLEGSIQSQGQLLLTDSLSWQGSTQLDSINLAAIAPDYPAMLSGQLNLEVSNPQGEWQGAVNKLDINGTWLDYPLQADGKIDYHQARGLNIEQFYVANGDNKIELVGSLNPQNALDFTFNLQAPNISQSMPNVSGSLVIEGQVSGSLDAPKLRYHIDANEVQTAELQINKIAGDGQLKWDQEKPVALQLSVDNVLIAGNQIDNISLQVSGNAADHQLAVVGSGEQFNLNIALAGTLSSNAWQGSWVSGVIETAYTHLELTQPFDITANWQQQFYAISPHCWQDNSSQLCINQAHFEQQRAEWDVSLTDFEWADLLAKLALGIPSIQTDSLFNLQTKGSWDVTQLPIADLSISVSAAPWTVETTQSLNLDMQAFAVNAKIDQQNITADIDLQGVEVGGITVHLQTDSALLNQASLQQRLSQPIAGNLNLTGVDLTHFKALVPELETLQGLIKGQAELSGTLAKPLVNGELALENAALKGEALPVSLSEVNQNIRLNGDNADFDGSYKFGKGYGELSGEISWLPELVGKVNIKGDALEVNYQDMVKAKISPDINLAFAPAGLDVQGEVVVPYARVKIRDLPPGSVSPSSDVILVEQQQSNAQAQQNLDLSILLKIDPQKRNEVKLDAYGLTSDLRGSLRVTNNTKGMLANGEINLVNGRYRGNGQNLLIREGDISFNGTLDRPYLNIEAIRDPALTEDDVISGLRVQGAASKPSVEIFSEPEMEQQQALSYMLTGRGIGESSDDSQDTVITNALLSIGLGQSENLVSKVGNKLGFEDVTLDTTGQGDNTQLSLTGTIAPGLQLRYGVGVFDSVSEVAIRYELIPKLYVEAISGLNNAIDFYYQFSFEGSQNKKILADEK